MDLVDVSDPVRAQPAEGIFNLLANTAGEELRNTFPSTHSRATLVASTRFVAPAPFSQSLTISSGSRIEQNGWGVDFVDSDIDRVLNCFDRLTVIASTHIAPPMAHVPSRSGDWFRNCIAARLIQ